MFLLLYLFLAVVIVYVGLAIYLYYFTKKRFSNKKYISKLVVAFFILLPTYDIILTNILGGFYCLTTPKTFINKKVDYPESIYWEDNVYPGFSEDDRKLMIRNYLDGVHLKTMALNGDDGKIYVYTYKEIPQIYFTLREEYKELSKQYEAFKIISQKVKENGTELQREEAGKKVWQTDDKRNAKRVEIQELVQTFTLVEQIHTKQSMPKLNYTVTFNEVPLNFFTREFIYSDVTSIINNATNEVVAHNQRVMRLFYNMLPDLAGGRYYQGEEVCGDSYFWFQGRIFTYNRFYASGKHIGNLNKYLYTKYIKKEGK